LILALAVRDLQSRYVGTLGGILWTFAHPLAVITIFYFVFAVGFKSQGPEGTPFMLWFVCGLVPWFFFNETLLAATDSITRHAHLIKKTVFPSEILPLVNITAGLVPHTIFLLIVVGLLAWFQVPFKAERLLVVYFLLCTCLLLVGLSWLLSAIQVFYRDVSHALSIVLNLLFWTTPIVWSPEMIPEGYRGLLFCNPMYYIIEGYRGLLVFNETVWPSAGHTAYFWCVVTAAFMAGAYVFNRLKPEFADVM
jgi:ABC-type polysaccharide/polyol phosphate export permease